MSSSTLAKRTGALFIIGAVIVNIPYTLLIMNFDYPDILRQDPQLILTMFHQGGSNLIRTRFAFGWTGILLLIATILNHQLLSKTLKHRLIPMTTVFGIVSLISQLIGLLRRVFVVPVLATIIASPASSEATKSSALVAFQVINQFGGVLLGEHIGQMFIIMWMLGISIVIIQSGYVSRWIGRSGIIASILYFLAQGELFWTVMPSFPVVERAGLVGSISWLVWMIIYGIALMLKRYPDSTTENTSR